MIINAQRLEALIPVDELFEKGIINIKALTDGCSVCPNFGRRWACPPFDFDTEALWKSFGTLRVIAVKIRPDEAVRSKIYAPAEYESFTGTLLAPYKKELDAEVLRRERETSGSRAISPGSCDGCPQPCPKTNGKPCRRVNMRPTLEALGADVGRITADYLHTPLLWLQNGLLPEYLVLAGGLLEP